MAKDSKFFFLNPYNGYAFFNDLVVQYGLKFNLLVMSTYIGVRGGLKKFLDLNETAYYKEAGYPVSVNQVNQTISRLPGSILGIAGLLSDLFPFAGYEKSSYLFVYTILGSGSLIALILFPFNADSHAPTIPAVLFFLCHIHVQFNDLLVEGKCIDLMKQFPKNRGSLIAFSFFCITIGGLPPSILVGFMADYLPSPRYTFWIALPFTLQTFIFILSGCMPNDKAHPARNNRFDYNKAKLQFPVVIMNIGILCASTGSFLFGLFGNPNNTFYYSICVSIIIIISSFALLPIIIAKINLYLFLGQAMYLQIQPTLEYFYLADEVCVPNGPHFDYVYLKTYISLVTQVGQLIGLWLYQSILTRMKYRQIFWISTILRVGASFFDLMIVNRWNISIGINDQYFYLFGHAIIYEITYMLDYLPFALMIAKFCPKNIEVMLFAVLGGFTLYGGINSGFIGSYLSNFLNIATNLEGGRCNFDKIGWLVFIGNLALPILLVPLAFLLIPNRPVGENIADSLEDYNRYLFNFMKFNRIDYSHLDAKG